jgi:hypothetical protein
VRKKGLEIRPFLNYDCLKLPIFSRGARSLGGLESGSRTKTKWSIGSLRYYDFDHTRS